MVYDFNTDVNRDDCSIQLRQKNFMVRWFSRLGRELFDQPSYGIWMKVTADLVIVMVSPVGKLFW